jgi:16S rRNA (cytosine1402-N4)-methyltransferase
VVEHVHHPVLLAETIAGLRIQPHGFYVDATFGRGGHSRAILEHLAEDGGLWVCDRDPQAIQVAQQLAAEDARVTVLHSDFAALPERLRDAGLAGKVDGMLMDLGVSSPQLDDAARGFSFQQDGPLDMRMDPTSGESVADWLGYAAEEKIADVLYQYGEERQSRRIAKAIVHDRALAPFTRTQQLASLIERLLGRGKPGQPFKHPATRSFQALRIFINQELPQLDRMLDAAISLLAPQGRLVVISFHSLEDRRVKQFMQRQSGMGDDFPAEIPQQLVRPQWVKKIGGAIRAGAEELAGNPRARSAVLRVAERTEVAA